jgi:hypothetical protein
MLIICLHVFARRWLNDRRRVDRTSNKNYIRKNQLDIVNVSNVEQAVLDQQVIALLVVLIGIYYNFYVH